MTIWDRIGREAEDLAHSIRELPVSSPASVEAVRNEIESRFDFRTPVPLEDLTEHVIELLRKYNVHVIHPRYFGLFNPSVPEASVVGDALVALYNPQLAAWSHAPAANEIERLTLRHLAGALGLDPDSTFANFTTGGLESNLSAVLVALGQRFPDVHRHGLASAKARPVVYVTSESHHSFVKICRITGLGTEALREVPTTPVFTMDSQALREHIAADARAGRCPFMIVGTAGTTGGGLIDPLAELAAVAADASVWFHVDAAWGGAAALVERLRPALAGIERADSITWDAHKWLSVPMGAGMFFCRHREAVRRAFDVSTSYMPSAAVDDPADAYLTTLQWSRRAIGLKLFMSLAVQGSEGFAERIEHQTRMGDLLRAKLRDAGWIVVNETPLPLVCTTHRDIRSGRCTTPDIVHAVVSTGKAWISDVVLGGRERVIRACITSFRTVEEDLDVLVTELDRARTSGQG